VRSISLPDPASIRRAHERFLDTGEIPEGIIPDVIRRSWLRCSNAGVPSDRLRDIARLENHRLQAELDRHGDLIAAAEPVMDMLHTQLEHTGAIVLLCAPDGLILRSMGDPTFVPRAGRVALEPGVSWTEEHKGTNGIGTAIFERQPVVVYAAQHYVERNHFLSCSGTPVFSPGGDLAAVLDITGDYRSHHSHTLALAQMASRNIERQLFLRHHRDDLVLQIHGNPSYLGSLFDGRVVFSEDGSFVTAELNACETLGISANEQVLGGFEELFDAPFSGALHRLRSRETVTQLHLRRTGEAVYVQLARALPSARSAAPPLPSSSEIRASVTAAGNAGESLAEIEMKAIRDAVASQHGNLSAAAKQLGIGRATLYRKLKPRHE
jgi:transcriptional regulator of acetoin/glycerol metabolism